MPNLRLNTEIMEKIAEGLWIRKVELHYGSEGMIALRKLMISIKKLFQYVEPETITGSLIVFVRLSHRRFEIDQLDSRDIYSLETLPQNYRGIARSRTSIIEIQPDDRLTLWTNVIISHEALASDALVYVYESRGDNLLLGGSLERVPNPSPSHASVFSVPTYRSLDIALEKYDAHMARYSSCLILQRAWFDDRHLFLRSKPESIMRDSLLQFLRSSLGAEVRPEQFVDDSHPCDIKVTWMLTNRIAFIEIKWLGKSKNLDGEITTTYTEVRARDGAQQLAEYLDNNKPHSPLNETMGYLVVFDARRRGLEKETSSLSFADAMWYSNKEIEFAPKYHDERQDFKPPIRMFCEPIID